MERHAETRELKRALEKAGIGARVCHGGGTTLNWLLVEVHDIKDKDRAQEIAKEVTGRCGISDGLLIGSK
jgi:hypothetical protein